MTLTLSSCVCRGRWLRYVRDHRLIFQAFGWLHCWCEWGGGKVEGVQPPISASERRWLRCDFYPYFKGHFQYPNLLVLFIPQSSPYYFFLENLSSAEPAYNWPMRTLGSIQFSISSYHVAIYTKTERFLQYQAFPMLSWEVRPFLDVAENRLSNKLSL
jgi:hypothetical protein